MRPTKGGNSDASSQKLLLLKTYKSPWEKAMKGDEILIATMKTGMPGPIEKTDALKYKSFNRYCPRGPDFVLKVLCNKRGWVLQ